MRKWDIQLQVVVVALLPAALIAVFLTVYYTRSRLDMLEQGTLERARALASQFASLSEFGVITRDRQGLQALAKASLAQDRALARVTIRGANGQTLARAQRDDLASEEIDTEAEGFRTLTQRISPTLPRASADNAGPASTSSPAGERGRIGELEVVVDLRPVRQREYAVLWESLGISGLALVVTGLLAVQIGRGVTVPLRRINETVERIRRGDLEARPQGSAQGELGSLEQGITEMAQAIEAQQSTMQAQVDRKTRELEETLRELEQRNAELEESHLEAQAASEFKSRFLANISHEIRTPMNSIVGFAELLESAHLDTVEADYLENIRESARSLLGLLNGILDLSKIESGRMELDYVATDINELLIEVFHLFGPHAMRKGVEFLVHPMSDDGRRVYTDPLRLKQVLINLVSNAVKFTDSGYVELSAEGWVRSHGTTEICFTVADTGSGIPESAQTRLFQAFAQGRPRGETRGQDDEVGTGLGLHIASEIVLLMDGSIEFASEPGVGTTFWLTATFDEARPGPLEAPSAGQRHRLLLVDPGERSRRAYARALERAGFEVATLDSALSADGELPTADAVLVHVPAAEVVDGQLPAADTSLRRHGRWLCALAHAHDAATREALERVGYDVIVPKTPDTEVLKRALHSVLGPRVRDTSAPATTRPAAQGLRVLVIDDHPVNRRLFESYLRDDGGESVAMGSSDEALYAIETDTFDAILLDIHLPDRDGIATAELVRSGATANALTPIIAITADAFQDQNERAMQAGINELLIKPVTRDELRSVLSTWCGGGDEADRFDYTGEGPAATPEALPDDDGTSRPAAYDHAEAVRRAAGREDVAQELFGVLQTSLPETRARLCEAAGSGDIDAVRSAAHSLRGAAAYCGVPRLEQAVARVSGEARQGSRAGLRQALDELIDAIDELQALDDAPNQPSQAGTAAERSGSITPGRGV